MFHKPATFQDFLSRNNHIDEIYDAMAKDDPSEVVVRALDVLKKTSNLPYIMTTVKSEVASTLHRNAGNNAFKTGHYQTALSSYNKALLFAPKNSREMKLAYSNRSALFLKLNLWTASKNDIEKCFALGCPIDIHEKLTKRNFELRSYLSLEGISKSILVHAVEKCINYGTFSCNSQIPCASSNVKVVTSTIPKIVASTDIKVGSVVASEIAYVSFTDKGNDMYSCHFCQKVALNLIPCDGCCFALFCDEQCKNKCMTEFHVYECKIMDAIRAICLGPMPNLMVKASLKLRSLCKTWKELIYMSHNMGINKIESSCVQEIYDRNNIYSVLSFKDNKPFVYGILYNASFVCAAILHYLETLCSSFLPKDVDEKQHALQAFGRIMMFLAIYQIPLHIIQGVTNVKLDRSAYMPENYGLYPFIGKLNNCCNPNLIVVNNNNKLTLLAIQPIKSGEELTVSHLRHRYDPRFVNRQVQNIQTFLYYGTICNCMNCINSSVLDNKQEKLSKYQKKYFSQLNMRELNEKIRKIEITQVYQKLLEALEIFKDVPNTKEYIDIYQSFQKCICICEVVFSDNNMLDAM